MMEKEHARVRRVLGIDPGLANTGFGVVDFCEGRYRMVSYGCITTKADQPHGERLLTIYSRLVAVIQEFQPDEAGMETLSADVGMVPDAYTPVDKDTAAKVQRLIDRLEDNDDVQNVYHTAEYPDDFEPEA